MKKRKSDNDSLPSLFLKCRTHDDEGKRLAVVVFILCSEAPVRLYPRLLSMLLVALTRSCSLISYYSSAMKQDDHLMLAFIIMHGVTVHCHRHGVKGA